MTSNEIFDRNAEYLLPVYARFPVAFERGEGACLYSPEGKKYIDLASGIGVNSIGYTHPKWVAAVTKQAGTLAHVSNLYHTAQGGMLAERLCAISGMKGAFFANSGAESNEGIIKLARKYSHDKYGDLNRSTVICLEQSFHGRTITTLAATGQDRFHHNFEPFTEGFKHVPAEDLDAVRAADDGSVCAVLVEPVRGEGGVLPLSEGYLKGLQALCREKDWLFMVDEVQTGIGRTGDLFCYMGLGLEPDAVSFAKGIAGGLPLGGFLVGEKALGTLGAGDHATTFGANPICCAAAMAVLEVLVDDGAMAQVAAKGAKIRAAFEEMGFATRGRGLMIGVPMGDRSASDVVKGLLERGVVALTAGGNTLRMLPPLTISDAEIDEALAIIREYFA